MSENEELKRNITERLMQVMDPETGMSVQDMGLVRDLEADGGRVRLTFRPTSPVCPLAYKLGADIQDAVLDTPGVQDLELSVDGHNQAPHIQEILAQARQEKE